MELNGASLGTELRALVKSLFKVRDDDPPVPPKDRTAVVIFTIEPPKPKGTA